MEVIGLLESMLQELYGTIEKDGVQSKKKSNEQSSDDKNDSIFDDNEMPSDEHRVKLPGQSIKPDYSDLENTAATCGFKISFYGGNQTDCRKQIENNNDDQSQLEAKISAVAGVDDSALTACSVENSLMDIQAADIQAVPSTQNVNLSLFDDDFLMASTPMFPAVRPEAEGGFACVTDNVAKGNVNINITEQTAMFASDINPNRDQNTDTSSESKGFGQSENKPREDMFEDLVYDDIESSTKTFNAEITTGSATNSIQNIRDLSPIEDNTQAIILKGSEGQEINDWGEKSSDGKAAAEETARHSDWSRGLVLHQQYGPSIEVGKLTISIPIP